MKRLVTFFTLLALVLAVSCAQVYAAQTIETISVFTAGPAGDIGAFALKDGVVTRNGVALDSYVHEVPPEVEGPVRYWSSFDSYTDDAVPESERGVYFFAHDGVCLTHVPVESGVQDVIFSPSGRRFVLVTGSGMRPDIFFEVYDGTEKIAELTGIRGTLMWIDPVRFVLTRIDDGYREGRFLNLSYRLRLSAVMYDTALREAIVLKGSTDTQDFWAGGVTEDGLSLNIAEDYVNSEEDWADEEKIETRTIQVEIPAAG